MAPSRSRWPLWLAIPLLTTLGLWFLAHQAINAGAERFLIADAPPLARLTPTPPPEREATLMRSSYGALADRPGPLDRALIEALRADGPPALPPDTDLSGWTRFTTDRDLLEPDAELPPLPPIPEGLLEHDGADGFLAVTQSGLAQQLASWQLLESDPSQPDAALARLMDAARAGLALQGGPRARSFALLNGIRLLQGVAREALQQRAAGHWSGGELAPLIELLEQHRALDALLLDAIDDACRSESEFLRIAVDSGLDAVCTGGGLGPFLRCAWSRHIDTPLAPTLGYQRQRCALWREDVAAGRPPRVVPLPPQGSYNRVGRHFLHRSSTATLDELYEPARTRIIEAHDGLREILAELRAD